VIVLVAALAACSNEASQSLPEELLGRWYYMGSSGGIAGGGMGDSATGYIEIEDDHAYVTFTEDGTRMARIPFTLRRGSTIFSSDEQWMIQTEDGIEEVFMISEDGQTMSLSENVYDGFGRSYARSR
jgi:hypothetical protein